VIVDCYQQDLALVHDRGYGHHGDRRALERARAALGEVADLRRLSLPSCRRDCTP
jgi:hypothetical protein